MNRVAVVYWSGTGHTQAMAEAVAGACGGKLMTAVEFSPDQAAEYDVIAFGCPAMGAEVLEEAEMEPFVCDVEGFASGKKIALFGSYGWGDGEWMRNWVKQMQDAGAEVLGGEDAICCDAPDDEAEEKLVELGKKLAE